MLVQFIIRDLLDTIEGNLLLKNQVLTAEERKRLEASTIDEIIVVCEVTTQALKRPEVVGVIV
jgi:hypothetical protein